MKKLKSFWYEQNGDQFLSIEFPKFYDKILGVVEGIELHENKDPYTKRDEILVGDIQLVERSQSNGEHLDIRVTKVTRQ